MGVYKNITLTARRPILRTIHDGKISLGLVLDSSQTAIFVSDGKLKPANFYVYGIGIV